MKNENVFDLIKEQYFAIDKNYDALFTSCKTDEERKNFKRDYLIARANYRKSLNLSFDENDPIINDLTEELKKLNEKIEKEIKNIGSALNVLTMISESVKIASSIIVMVMSLI